MRDPGGVRLRPAEEREPAAADRVEHHLSERVARAVEQREPQHDSRASRAGEAAGARLGIERGAVVAHRAHGRGLVEPPVAPVGVNGGERFLDQNPHVVARERRVHQVGGGVGPDAVHRLPRPGEKGAHAGRDGGGEVEDGFGAFESGAQGEWVEQIYQDGPGALALEGGALLGRAAEGGDVVAECYEGRYDAAADRAGGAGDENAHRAYVRRVGGRWQGAARASGCTGERRRRHARPGATGCA